MYSLDHINFIQQIWGMCFFQYYCKSCVPLMSYNTLVELNIYEHTVYHAMIDLCNYTFWIYPHWTHFHPKSLTHSHLLDILFVNVMRLKRLEFIHMCFMWIVYYIPCSIGIYFTRKANNLFILFHITVKPLKTDKELPNPFLT